MDGPSSRRRSQAVQGNTKAIYGKTKYIPSGAPKPRDRTGPSTTKGIYSKRKSPGRQSRSKSRLEYGNRNDDVYQRESRSPGGFRENELVQHRTSRTPNRGRSREGRRRANTPDARGPSQQRRRSQTPNGRGRSQVQHRQMTPNRERSQEHHRRSRTPNENGRGRSQVHQRSGTPSRGRSQEYRRRSRTPNVREHPHSHSQRRSMTPNRARTEAGILRRSKSPSRNRAKSQINLIERTPSRAREQRYAPTRRSRSPERETSFIPIRDDSPERERTTMRIHDRTIERTKFGRKKKRSMSPEMEGRRSRTKSPKPIVNAIPDDEFGRQSNSPYPGRARSKSAERRTTTITVKRRGKSPGRNVEEDSPPTSVVDAPQGFKSKQIYGGKRGKQEYVVSNKNKTLVLEFLMNQQQGRNNDQEENIERIDEEMPNNHGNFESRKKPVKPTANRVGRIGAPSEPKHEFEGKLIEIPANMDDIEGIGFESFDMDMGDGMANSDTKFFDINRKGENLKEYLLKSVECKAYTCNADTTIKQGRQEKDNTDNNSITPRDSNAAPPIEIYDDDREEIMMEEDVDRDVVDLDEDEGKDIDPDSIRQDKLLDEDKKEPQKKSKALSIFERFLCSDRMNCSSPKGDNMQDEGSRRKNHSTEHLLAESEPTALYVAVGSKNWTGAIARILEAPDEASIWVNATSSSDSTLVRFLPLHLACLSSRDIPLLLVTLLVQAYPESVKLEAMGKLPIHMACAAQADHRVVFLLLNSLPESLYMKDDQGNTPIEAVSLTEPCKARTNIIKVLTKKMENSVVTNPTVLYNAIDSQNWNSAMRRLVEMPQESTTWVSFNKKKVEVRFLPIHAACLLQAPMLLIADLIQAYPDAVKKKTLQGKLPIHIACAAHNDPRVIEMLLEAWPEALYVKDSEGHTPVEVATMVELNPDRNKILDVLRRNYAKRKHNIVFAPTELYSLIGSKDWNAAVRRVLEAPHEASTWIGSCNKKADAKLLPLHYACSLQSPLLLTAVLIQSYPDGLKLKNGEGKIPLHLACEKEADHRVVSLLLHAYPESFFVEDAKGNTSIQLTLLSSPSEERTRILETLTMFEEKHKGLKFTSNTTQAIDSIVNPTVNKLAEDIHDNGTVTRKDALLPTTNDYKDKKKKKSLFKRGGKGKKSSSDALWEDDDMFVST